jgi:L,D-transpeptidase ErfK/SrfK
MAGKRSLSPGVEIRLRKTVMLMVVLAILETVAFDSIATDWLVGDRIIADNGNVMGFTKVHCLIGEKRQHQVRQKETLLDIARQYDLGFNEIRDRYPHMDPWLPPRGMAIQLPTQWILPEIARNCIVVNLAELRLFFTDSENYRIYTFPISIGEKAWPTPEGTFTISTKITQPAWTVPPSLKHKYPFSVRPPGPDNPLGRYWLGLENTHYGIHGTDFPWSIGRAVTRGCLRLYPEDIKRLFHLVQPGTRVKIIYAPIKITIREGRVFAEIHGDIYHRIGNFYQYGFYLLQKKKITALVNLEKYLQALEGKNGVPVDITGSSP